MESISGKRNFLARVHDKAALLLIIKGVKQEAVKFQEAFYFMHLKAS